MALQLLLAVAVMSDGQLIEQPTTPVPVTVTTKLQLTEPSLVWQVTFVTPCTKVEPDGGVQADTSA